MGIVGRVCNSPEITFRSRSMLGFKTLIARPLQSPVSNCSAVSASPILLSSSTNQKPGCA